MPREARKPEVSDFWKPRTAGEALYGRVSEIVVRRFEAETESVKFEPAIIFAADGSDPKAFGVMEININRWLAKLVKRSDIGRAIAVKYTGLKPTPRGDMRTFKVYDLSESEFAELRARFKGLQDDAPSGPGEGHDETDDDDLPF